MADDEIPNSLYLSKRRDAWLCYRCLGDIEVVRESRAADEGDECTVCGRMFTFKYFLLDTPGWSGGWTPPRGLAAMREAIEDHEQE